MEAYALGVDGVKLVDEGKYAEGIKLLKQAHFLQPADYDFAFELGKAYFISGEIKKAEKQLFALQYHTNVQSDLYVLLSDCYASLAQDRNVVDETRKKELDALRYGIQKLPTSGILYLQLAKRNLELERSVEALAALESGIINAPDFAENYYWAAKLMKASANHFWAWIYAETCFNMTDDVELQRSSARIIDQSLKVISSSSWTAEPNKMETDLGFLVNNTCLKPKETSVEGLAAFRKCLLAEWKVDLYSFNFLFDRIIQLERKGWLESYVASHMQEADRNVFLNWLAQHPQEFEAYGNWRFWNPMVPAHPMRRTPD